MKYHYAINKPAINKPKSGRYVLNACYLFDYNDRYHCRELNSYTMSSQFGSHPVGVSTMHSLSEFVLNVSWESSFFQFRISHIYLSTLSVFHRYHHFRNEIHWSLHQTAFSFQTTLKMRYLKRNIITFIKFSLKSVCNGAIDIYG